jgi:hypothetical protein
MVEATLQELNELQRVVARSGRLDHRFQLVAVDADQAHERPLAVQAGKTLALQPLAHRLLFDAEVPRER